MPRISRITLYPIKSLPGVDVQTATFTAAGSLLHDRAYAMQDDAGACVNGKASADVHRLRAQCFFDDGVPAVTLELPGETRRFRLCPTESSRDIAALALELSSHFRRTIRLVHDSDGGFPDDTDSPGPTIVSSSSLEEVTRWYGGLTVQGMRSRFRANIELGDCDAFWEDGLYGPPGVARRIRVGTTELFGVNPCKRCVVPSRDPVTGEGPAGFQRTFVESRRRTLPAWVDASRFDFYYRLAVNTRPAADMSGQTISVGDRVELV